MWPAVETFCTIMSTLTPGLGQRAEHARGDTGPVGYLLDRDLRLGDVVRDTRDDRLLHRLAFLGDPRAGGPGETRTDVDLHAVVACELDRTQREHAAARRRHLEHLVEGDVRKLPGGGDDARVGAVDTLDVGVDLAGIRRQRRGQRDRRRVGAAPAQRGDVAARSTRPGSRPRSRPGPRRASRGSGRP